MGNCCGSLYESVTHSKRRRRVQGWRATGVVGLRDEHLKELPPTLRDLSSRLTVVDASINHIRSLPSFLGEFHQLHRLSLSRNELITLPNSMSQLKKLKVLFLDYNKISTFPSCLVGLVQMEKLSMAGNCLTTIPEELAQLALLKDIDFSDNRITDIRCDFEALQNVERLVLTNNNLQSVPLSLRFCIRMKELYLERNRLQHLQSEILLECRSLQTLTLDGNPISMQSLEETQGYREFEKRRKEKAHKAISSQVMMGESTLNEVITRKT